MGLLAVGTIVGAPLLAQYIVAEWHNEIIRSHDNPLRKSSANGQRGLNDHHHSVLGDLFNRFGSKK